VNATSSDDNSGNSPAWASFPDGLAISLDAQSLLTDLITDLGSLDVVGARLPDAHAIRSLEVLATIRETAERYTRIMTEYIAGHPDLAGTVSDRRLAALARASNKTVARWQEQPVTVKELEATRAQRPVPRT
jgi:hypothetical protein